VDGLHGELAAAGVLHPVSREGVDDTDFGTREFATLDADGNLVTQSGDTLRVKGTGMDLQDLSRDNLKWSVNVEKVLHRHIRFTGQIANDHFIPRPARTGIVAEDGGFREAFTDPRDWYFMFRMGFFF